MKFFLSNIKKDMVINALLLLIIGCVLLLFPTQVVRMTCYALGAILLVYGGMLLHQYFSSTVRSSLTLAFSVVLLIAGGFVILRYDLVISLIPFLMGIVFLFFGLQECRMALSLKQADYPKWSVNLLLAVLVLIVAAVLLFYPFRAASLAVRFIGSALIYSALSQLWTIHCLSSHAKDFFQ